MAKKKTTKTKDIGLIPRPPIVVVMGHIDHGKTTLLDFIRKTKITEKESSPPRLARFRSVVESEAGGITQHIDAYEIEFKGKKITFIDTPGHEAFSKMRSRGARVADVAILVVAAEEGVKEQTKEAIRHIKEAEIPFIVAINKIDKPGANPEKIKKELAESEVLVESWGGKIPSVEISAKSGQRVDELLELILIAAELEELKANPADPASGIIIEAHLDSRRGPLASLIVKNGTLRTGDYIAAGTAGGRVKFMENDRGQSLKEAGFSMPVLCGGFENVPQVGEEFFGHSQKTALENLMAEKIKLTLIEPPAEEAPAGKFLKIVLKADVSGSLEALADSLSILSHEDIRIQFIKKEVGEINESDVKLAGALGGVIVGFRVKIPPAVQNFSRERKIEIIASDIIYDLLEKVKKLMKEAVGPKTQRLDLGRMKVLAIFRTEKNRMIVGGKVLSGKLEKGAKIEVLRNDEIVGNGRPVGLQQDKKEVGEVREGKECGVLFEGDVRIETGDILNFYREETKKIVI